MVTQASATSAGEHAVTGVIPPESPAGDSLPATQLRLADLAKRFGALEEREAGHWHQAQEALSSVQELSEQVNRLAARPAGETGYQENL